MQTAAGKLYLFVAIDRTSKFACVELHERATKMIAAEFLRQLNQAVPYQNPHDPHRRRHPVQKTRAGPHCHGAWPGPLLRVAESGVLVLCSNRDVSTGIRLTKGRRCIEMSLDHPRAGRVISKWAPRPPASAGLVVPP